MLFYLSRFQTGLNLSDDHTAGQTVDHLVSNFLRGGKKNPSDMTAGYEWKSKHREAPAVD